MLPASVETQVRTRQPARVLIVDDEPALVNLIQDVVEPLKCKLTVAKTLAQAKKLLAGDHFELMLADVNLPDGDGLSLFATLRRHQPAASAIMITGAPNVDGAITALRNGAVDFVPKPFNNEHLLERVSKALQNQSIQARQTKRLSRLRDAVRKLGIARRVVSKKVDLLCNDLVSAYGELSRQLDVVRTQENFRKQIEPAKDLEQVLCHTMDWLLRQMGYANVALWLASEDGEYQLGAYMKYTIPGEEATISAMQEGLLPLTIHDGFIHSTAENMKSRLGKEEQRILAKQDILGMCCSYLGEPLAAIVFFRDATAQFNENDEATLKAIAPIFATALATVVRDPSEEGGPDTFTDDDETLPGKGERREDDWWKRGEPPPF